MGEAPERVHAVGEPGLDAFVRVPKVARAELAAALGLDAERRWILFTYHPETLIDQATNLARVRTALDALARLDGVQVVMTWPNADPGGRAIGELLVEREQADPDRFKLRRSLGSSYLHLLREAAAMVGNSSSGLIEAPSVGLPVLNIGRRQAGRPLAANVRTIEGTAVTAGELDAALADLSRIPCENPYGDGHTAERIKRVLATVPLSGLFDKPFRSNKAG
jgi:UDP-hydrolysing UDP-N-acetyl-D-glucosamine 2-epimerase